MKKLLLVTLLFLFSCSKISMDSGFSGDQIIGTYQLIIQTSADQEEFSFWDTRKNSPTNGFSVGQSEKFLTTNLTGKVNFSSDLKGYYDISVDNENIKVDFDWSYDGSKWYLTDINSNDWIITNSNRCPNGDMIYCSGQDNTGGIYIMLKVTGYGKGDWRNYKLVF